MQTHHRLTGIACVKIIFHLFLLFQILLFQRRVRKLISLRTYIELENDDTLKLLSIDPSAEVFGRVLDLRVNVVHWAAADLSGYLHVPVAAPDHDGASRVSVVDPSISHLAADRRAKVCRRRVSPARHRQKK